MALYLIEGIPAGFVTLSIIVEVKKLEGDNGPRVDASTDLSKGVVDLEKGNDDKWYGHVAASPGTEVRFNAVARVKEGGSLEISIMAPGNATKSVTGNTLDGVCETGPFFINVEKES